MTVNSIFERGKLWYFLEFLLFTGAALLEWSSDLKFHFLKGKTMVFFRISFFTGAALLEWSSDPKFQF